MDSNNHSAYTEKCSLHLLSLADDIEFLYYDSSYSVDDLDKTPTEWQCSPTGISGYSAFDVFGLSGLIER